MKVLYIVVLEHILNPEPHIKGAGLGLFPSDSLESQSYEFIEIAHIGLYYGVN